MTTTPELTIIMPAYNEEEAITGVTAAWVRELDPLEIDYRLHVYDDGSRDRTLAILHGLEPRYPRLRVTGQSNSGHGPTILRAYREAESEWIFQTDSDGELGPEDFAPFWARRHDFDLLIGRRQGRDAPLPRRIMTTAARWTVRLGFGQSIYDVNAPYRLMRREPFRPLFEQLPTDTFAPNVTLSGLAAATGLRLFEHPIRNRPRAGGQPSLNRWALLRAARRSLTETFAAAWRFRRAAARQRHR